MESNKENRKNKAKEETMKFFKIFLLLIFASLFIVACGDGGGDGGDGAGACVDSYSYGHCHNNYDANECVGDDETYHSNSSCQDLGYTKTCPADGPNTYRLPSYSC